jgi:hypothetical protein
MPSAINMIACDGVMGGMGNFKPAQDWKEIVGAKRDQLQARLLASHPLLFWITRRLFGGLFVQDREGEEKEQK